MLNHETNVNPKSHINNVKNFPASTFVLEIGSGRIVFHVFSAYSLLNRYDAIATDTIMFANISI